MTKAAEECIDHGQHTRDDYATITYAGHQVRLHRYLAARRYNLDIWDTQWLACHSCGNRRCINHNHLYVGDKSSNMLDVFTHGTLTRGESHPNAKLSDSVIEAIKIDRRTQKQIAAEHGISQSLVSRIKNGERRV